MVLKGLSRIHFVYLILLVVLIGAGVFGIYLNRSQKTAVISGKDTFSFTGEISHIESGLNRLDIFVTNGQNLAANWPGTIVPVFLSGETQLTGSDGQTIKLTDLADKDTIDGAGILQGDDGVLVSLRKLPKGEINE